MTQTQIIDVAIEKVAKSKKKDVNEVTSFEVANQLAKDIIKQRESSNIESCGGWIHDERVEMNGDSFCPICGEDLRVKL